MTDLHPPHAKQNRLNGQCPDYRTCSLQIACSDHCWRLEPDLIDAVRRLAAKTVGVPTRAGPTSKVLP